MAFEVSQCDNNNDFIQEFVNWNRIGECDKANIRNYVDKKIIENKCLEHDVLLCCNANCMSPCHKVELNELLAKIKVILLQSTKEFCFANERRFKVIPGWNDHVRQLHSLARKAFLYWRDNGRHLYGSVYDNMKSSRSNFRLAFKKCKFNENDIRNGKLVDKLNDKNYKEFWSEVHKTNKHNLAYPTVIDGKCSNSDISCMFSEKYKGIFNKVYKNPVLCSNQVKLPDKKKVEILLKFSKDDVKRGIKLLKDGIGFDTIHSNHLKFASELLI